MNKYKLSENESQRAIEKKDQIRKRFSGFFSDSRSHDDPLLYDLIINMSHVSIDEAEQLIVDLIS